MVRVGPRFGKGETEGLASRELAGIEGLAIVRSHGMRYAIVIGPGHCGAHFDREALGAESKARDGDAVAAGTRGRGRRLSWRCGGSGSRRWGGCWSAAPTCAGRRGRTATGRQ